MPTNVFVNGSIIHTFDNDDQVINLIIIFVKNLANEALIWSFTPKMRR